MPPCMSMWAWNATQPVLIGTVQAVFDRAGLWLWVMVDEPARKVCVLGMMVGA